MWTSYCATDAGGWKPVGACGGMSLSTFEGLCFCFVFTIVDFFFCPLTLTNIFSHLFSFSDLYLFIDIFDYLLFDFFLMNWLVKGEKFELLPFSAL